METFIITKKKNNGAVGRQDKQGENRVQNLPQTQVKWVYNLDDGSGRCIECAVLLPPECKQNTEELQPLKVLGANIHRRFEKDVEGRGQRGINGGTKRSTTVENPRVPLKDISIGSIVKVKGQIGTWRNEVQVEAIKIEIVKGLDAEVKAWNEAREFKQRVLMKPWVC